VSLSLSFGSLHPCLALLRNPKHLIEPVELLMMPGMNAVQLEKYLITNLFAGKEQDSKYFAADSSFDCIEDQMSFQEK
jgi:hypothetical protein